MVALDLNEPEARVIGCLIEKQKTTPQYYPLTLNALVSACNQSSNRHPVVSYDDSVVQDALVSLRERGLTRIVYSTSNRATKYRHVLDEVLEIDDRELAVLDVLMLRGPQTVGELRTRTERLAEFSSLGEVEATLEGLARRDEPLVVRIERQPGQKEARYAHLLAGAPVMPEGGFPAAAAAREQEPRSDRGDRGDRIAAVEVEVAELRDEVAKLRAELEELRALWT